MLIGSDCPRSRHGRREVEMALPRLQRFIPKTRKTQSNASNSLVSDLTICHGAPAMRCSLGTTHARKCLS